MCDLSLIFVGLAIISLLQATKTLCLPSKLFGDERTVTVVKRSQIIGRVVTKLTVSLAPPILQIHADGFNNIVSNDNVKTILKRVAHIDESPQVYHLNLQLSSALHSYIKFQLVVQQLF